MVSLESCVVADPAVLSTVVGDEVVVMDASSGKYFTFKDSGADIWREIGQPKPVRELCQTLVANYDAPAERIETSVLAFLSDLLDRRLIKLA